MVMKTEITIYNPSPTLLNIVRVGDEAFIQPSTASMKIFMRFVNKYSKTNKVHNIVFVM